MQSRFIQGPITRFTLCLVMLLAPVALLHAQATLTTGTPFNVVNENSGKCIGASGQATANGTVLEMYSCANGTYSTQLAQQWIFTAASSGYYEIADAGATSEAWNVVSNGTSNGSLMQIWSYAANSNEEFSAVSLGSGYYKFVGQGSGLCLDVPSNSTANSVQLDIYTCNGTTAQAFKLVVPSGSGSGGGTFANKTLVLNFLDKESGNHTAIGVEDKAGGDADS
ncbi:MAG: RICIN domain-containing protein, partial [Terracidiphilus sp.]